MVKLVGRSLGAGAAVFVAVFAACATDTTPTTVIVSTSVGVDPLDFLGTVPCGPTPGAAQSYVVTLIQNNSPNPDTVITTSTPISCALPVSFEDVTVGKLYSASIQVFDVDKASVTDSTMPRWTTTCANGGIGAAQVFTDQRTYIANCVQLTGGGVGTTSVSVDATALTSPICTTADPPVCGCTADGGPVEKLTVSAPGTTLPTKTIACGQGPVVEDSGITPGKSYKFLVQGFAAGETTASWASSCSAIAESGINVLASCSSFSQNGYISIDATKAVADEKLVCGGTALNAVAMYDVTFDPPPDVVAAQGVACTTNAVLGPFTPGDHSGAITLRTAGGGQVGHALCTATVSPGVTTTATCVPN